MTILQPTVQEDAGWPEREADIAWLESSRIRKFSARTNGLWNARIDRLLAIARSGSGGTVAPDKADKELPETLEGHWTTPGGREMAQEYLALDRSKLAMANMSDFALANEQFLVDRHALNLMAYQTAAKERIRWLSAQLAAVKPLPAPPPAGAGK